MLKIIKFLLKSKKEFEVTYEEGEGEKYEEEDFKKFYSPSIELEIKSENALKHDIIEMLEKNGFYLANGAENIDVYEKEIYERTGKKRKVAVRLVIEVHYDDDDVYKIVIFVKKLIWSIKS
ncbi:hypothetical protein AZ270_gp13 [Acidianus tailed spindle virus]|uniref:hypothetical protein n=1 Tax=Acidianus tailed spindle virus TaxID=1797140 RepID=UPI00076F2B36|nr:hypothetical protein AZ270_gp13 [Acidianus tailed spindle virus]AME30036.1 hypothetical protein ATSV_C120 [Acidianus tailed spindle virus]